VWHAAVGLHFVLAQLPHATKCRLAQTLGVTFNRFCPSRLCVTQYTNAFDNAWLRLIEWVGIGKFAPRNEEDIQCFLYHGLVLELGTALGIRTKASSGKLEDGSKHFPDLVLSDDTDQPVLIVEIKYRSKDRETFYNGCKRDINKLNKYYESVPHRFVLFDAHPDFVFLDQDQYDGLCSLASENCKIIHFPTALSTLKGKAVARKAIDTMRKAGKDFREMGLKAAETTKRRRQGDA